jgi:hypothetical protein
LRLLCQNSIGEDDLRDANILICDFFEQFQDLYGLDEMKFNLHCHLHLVSQVRKYGPLNKISCFPFENLFRITREMYHGTVNFEGQIGRNLIKKKIYKNLLKDLYADPKLDNNLKSFISSYLINYKKETYLIDQKKIKICYLNDTEKQILSNLNEHLEVYKSNRALINYKS